MGFKEAGQGHSSWVMRILFISCGKPLQSCFQSWNCESFHPCIRSFMQSIPYTPCWQRMEWRERWITELSGNGVTEAFPKWVSLMPCGPPMLHAYIYSSTSQLANFLEEPELSTSSVIKRLYKKYQREVTAKSTRGEKGINCATGEILREGQTL